MDLALAGLIFGIEQACSDRFAWVGLSPESWIIIVFMGPKLGPPETY